MKKTEWNLSLLYKSPTDPKIERDVIAIEHAYADFAIKYKKATEGKTAKNASKKNYLTDERLLLKSLKDWEQLTKVAGAWKPALYFNYIKDVKSADPVAEANLNKLINRLTKQANAIVFYQISLGKIPADLKKRFLKSELLKPYQYFLKVIFDSSRYDLTEPEEKILNLKSLTGYQLWVQGQQKLLNSQSILHKGRNLPISEALGKVKELPAKERHALADEINERLKSISHFAEAELNAVILDKKINDELRGFEAPYSSTILSYQNDEKSILNLVDTITKHNHISQRFYRLKAKLLGQKRLEFSDRTAEIGKNKRKVPLEKGLGILTNAFSQVGPRYAQIFQEMVANGQIDFYPRKGKRGGAYCSSSIGNPTFILSNYTNDLDSVMTIGHEMGHAFHAHFSKSQPPLYESHTISTAEVASILFENFVFEEIFKTLTKEEQIIALHDRISDAIMTVFMQIAGFHFETELHNRIRKEGFLPGDEIARMLVKEMDVFLGPVFKLKELDGYFWVRWMHLRYFFYVYSYAYGQLISKAMYKRYKEDNGFLKQIEAFLSAGGSKSPEHIFRDIGIDVSQPEFFATGLRSIEDDIIRLEKLTVQRTKR